MAYEFNPHPTIKSFLAKSDEKASDLEHKRKLTFNINKYLATVVKGKQQFANLDLARKRAKNIKWKAIENLAANLESFEEKFTARGGKVLWAESTLDAQEHMLEICKLHHATSVVKSKSMVTEEIHLNDFLAKHNIDSIETDLGEYIQQLDNEPPYHIVTPAMHKSKEDVAQLFHDKLGVPPNLAPQELTLIARKLLRKKYTEASIGLTGGNFILPDIGGVCVTENEGNARLSTAFPKVQVCIVGIEKMLNSIEDLHTIWPLLATYGTGQNVTVYNTIFTGPKTATEVDGPEHMYVILLDNGRTNLLTDVNIREAAYCIRCGSCLNVCPVYKNVGGHAYETTYSGPIGSVISPHLKGMSEFKHLSNASSLCGNCTEACPVKINIHGMLHYNRTLAAQEDLNDNTEDFAWKMWKQAMLHRGFMDIAGAGLKTSVVNMLFKSSWGKRRDELVFTKSFKDTWKEQRKK
jgi:L-lactate dehydrogenase complex protein LldF